MSRTRTVLQAMTIAGMALALTPTASRALEPIDFNLSAGPQAGDAASAKYDSEDEDAFFSNGGKRRDLTGTIATIGPVPRSAAMPRQNVDVVATCRAVLADNLNYYNHNFIEGCKRATRPLGLR